MQTIITGVAALAAVAAACFTYQQVLVAKDHERRALRAYVVVDTKLVEKRDGKDLFVDFTAENMGQTPVYNLEFFVGVHVARDQYEREFPFEHYMAMDCKWVPESGKRPGKTFPKVLSEGKNPYWSLRSKDGLVSAFAAGNGVLVFGTVCYRDIFDDVHTTRICRYWSDPQMQSFTCDGVEEVYD